jgi:hypothetical protein
MYYREGLAHGDGGVSRRHGDGQWRRDRTQVWWSGRRRRRVVVPEIRSEENFAGDRQKKRSRSRLAMWGLEGHLRPFA